MNIMIALDGVLRSENGQPIPEGIVLYRAFNEHRVLLATDDTREKAEYWLKVEGLHTHTLLVTSDVAGRDANVRAGQLRYVAGLGSRIQLLIDPSPTHCADAMRAGITSLLFAAPKYQRPEWRPDAAHGMRPWGEITNELEEQALQAAKDVRASTN